MGETIQQAPGQIEALLEGPRKRPHVSAPERTPLAQAYRLHRPLIEASMSAGAEAAGYSAAESGLAGVQLGRTIEAALELGQVEYMQAELDWIRSLLAERGRPAESLPGYITAYSQAVRKVLGAAGLPVADWLDRYISEA
jgi:hypothetical protein